MYCVDRSEEPPTRYPRNDHHSNVPFAPRFSHQSSTPTHIHYSWRLFWWWSFCWRGRDRQLLFWYSVLLWCEMRISLLFYWMWDQNWFWNAFPLAQYNNRDEWLYFTIFPYVTRHHPVDSPTDYDGWWITLIELDESAIVFRYIRLG